MTATKIESGAFAERTSAGWRIVQPYNVGPLTGTPEEMLRNAALDAGVPAFGAAHPSVAGLTVVRVTSEPFSCDAARVLIEYGRSGSSSFGNVLDNDADNDGDAPKRISATTVSFKTDLDAADARITTSVPTTPLYIIPTNFEGDQPGFVTGVRPETVIGFERHEVDAPSSRARTFVGRLNDGSVGGGLYAAKTLLCTQINGLPINAGESYLVTYEFVYRSEGWQEEVRWRDLVKGVELADADHQDGTSRKLIDIIKTANFAGLSLDFTD